MMMTNLAMISNATPVELGFVVCVSLALLGFMWKILGEVQKASYRMGKIDQLLHSLVEDVKELQTSHKSVWQYLFKKYSDFRESVPKQ